MSFTVLPRTLKAVVFVAAAAMACAVSPTPPASAATCVKAGGRCYVTIQAAVDAAPSGSTVTVPAGRFAGGIVITKDLTLRGAGAKRTIIAGGEHVITVGEFRSKTVVRVRIADVTLTGGVARSAPGTGGAEALGGGLLVDAGEFEGVTSYTGPIVTVTDSVISGNRAEPSDQLLPEGPEQEEFWPRCATGFCPFAGTYGGGVFNAGTLTLVRSKVVNNRAGGRLGFEALGGGIYNVLGSLTLKDSLVSGNQARASAPHGHGAEGGGIFSRPGFGFGRWTPTVSLRKTSVTNNTASLDVDYPAKAFDGSPIDTWAEVGGVHVGEGSKVSVVSSHIDRNRVSFHNANGVIFGAFDSGLFTDLSPLIMRNSTVSGNRLTARVKSTTAETGPMGGAIDWAGPATISGSRFERNISEVIASDGDAAVAAAVVSLSTFVTGSNDYKSSITNSRISRNRAIARTKTGAATVVGAGLLNQSPLTLRRVKVTRNTGVADGRSGGAYGGGIAHGQFLFLPQDPGTPPAGLLLKNSSVTRNTLKGAKVKRQGSGIYATDPVSLVRTSVKRNRPAPQCVGCGGSSARLSGLSTGAGSGESWQDRDHNWFTGSPYGAGPATRRTR